jgi:hypothetical protein
MSAGWASLLASMQASHALREMLLLARLVGADVLALVGHQFLIAGIYMDASDLRVVTVLRTLVTLFAHPGTR